MSVVEKKPPIQPTDREVEHELKVAKAAADREAEKARENFLRKRAIRVELDRTGKLVSDDDASTRTLRPPQARGVRMLQEDLELAREEAASAVLAAAKRLREARMRQRHANAALAAYRFQHGLLLAHENACERVEAANERAERAEVELIASLIAREEACLEEAARARALVAAALEPLTGDDERAQVRHRASDEVPADLDEDGNVVAWRPRPVAGLFGLYGDDWRPLNDNHYEMIAGVVRGGRDRVHGRCGSTKVANEIVKALDGRK